MKSLKKSRRFISLFLAVMMLISFTGTINLTVFAESSRVYTHENYTIQYDIVSEWAGNQNIQVTIANTGTDTITNWAVGYNAGGDITGLWNAEIYGQQGTEYILKNVSYNSDIAPGATVNFGYTLNINNPRIPSDIVICANRVLISDGVNVQCNVSGDYGTTFNADMVITNNTSAPISGWQLSFDGNFEITNLWNAKVISNEATTTMSDNPDNGMEDINTAIINGKFVVAGESSTATIPAGGTVTFGFSGNKTADTQVNATNFMFSAIQIPMTFGFGDNDLNDETGDYYTPWLPTDLVKIAAYGEYIPELNAIVLEWSFRDNKGVFSIYENSYGKTLAAKVNNSKTHAIPVESYRYDYHYTIEFTDDDGNVFVSNDVKMHRDNVGYYAFEQIDSDNDELDDLYEAIAGSDKNNPDTDADGLPDGYEYYTLGTSPALSDTDSNGISDANEDFDNDMLNNLQEYQHNTDPFAPDTDYDNLTDYNEIYVHNTDPLKFDSDSDIVSDGDEIQLGLNPNNPATNGYPDSEYTVPQTVDENSDALEYINTIPGNPFTISVEMKSAGVAENNITAGESGFSAQILQNNAVLGIVPEIQYTEGLSVDEVKISFHIDSTAVASQTPSTGEETDLTGINRFNIFKYFEDDGILLPIKTEYNEATNEIYAVVDEAGTYCVFDVPKWVETLASQTGGELGEDEGEDNPPANIAFCLDSRIITAENFANIKSEIEEITENAFNRYSDIKIYIYYQTFGEDFNVTNNLLVDTESEEQNNYFYDSSSAMKALDELSITPANSKYWSYDLVEASDFMIEECDEEITLLYHIAAEDRIISEIDSAKLLSDYSMSNDRVHISLMCPFGTTEYDESAYAPTLATLSTGTVYREMDKTKYQLSSQQNYHVMTLADNNVATTEETDLSVATNNDLIDKLGIGRDQSSALIIKASGLTTITLDNPIHSYYDFYKSESQYSKVKYADFDFDGLYDYEEINFSSRFVKEHDNKLLLPTIYECMIDSDKPYVREGFDVFESYYKDKPKAYGRMLNDIRILPIKSDPTSADSDEDGIADGAKPLSKTDDNYLGDNYIEDSHPLQFSYLYYNDRLMELKEIYPNAKFLFEEYNVSLTDFVEFQYESAWKLTDETVYKAPEPEQTRLYYKHKIHYEDMALPNREGLRFYCDINNYLLEDDFVSVFAFYDVSRSNSPTIEEAQYALKGTVFYDYAQDFVDASIQNNLDLTYIISKCIHECGNNGSVLSNGNTATSGLSKDQTVYNVYAVGATDKEGFTPTELGIERASNEGWTTMRLAIIGGAEYIAETYMTAGQYTNYTQNYCLPVYAETGNMGYQYATDMSYAYDEASSVKNKIFNLKGKEELKFLIPYFLEK